MSDIKVNMISNRNAENDQVTKGKLGPYKKVFVERNSILTDAFGNKHLNCIYNLCMAGTIVLVLVNVAYEWRDNQVITFGFGNLVQKFYKIEIAALGWLINMLLTILTFPVFGLWSNIYRRTTYKKSIGTLFILLYCAYSIGIQAISVYVCLQYDLVFITSFALLIETIRVGMKNYAFVRSNVGRAMSHEEFNSPTFGHFMYFMWCPTMLYRDSYPRSSKRSWKLVFKYLLEFLLTVYSMSLLNSNYLQKPFANYGKSEVTLFSIFIRWIELTVIAAPLFYFYGFYMVQHAWLNMFAELLQFGDRVFYKDWWNATSIKEFYRWWNLLVHEWLYEYLYTDLYHHFTRKSFTLSAITTIIISAVFHEYVLVIALRFFVPVLLLMYICFGIMLMYIEMGKRIANILLWFSLITGFSLMLSLYLMEFYARINCPGDWSTNATISYYYTPMILACNNILFQ